MTHDLCCCFPNGFKSRTILNAFKCWIYSPVLTGDSLLLGIWLFVSRECYWISYHSIPHNVRVGDKATRLMIFGTWSRKSWRWELRHTRIIEVNTIQYLHIEGTTEPLHEINSKRKVNNCQCWWISGQVGQYGNEMGWGKDSPKCSLKSSSSPVLAAHARLGNILAQALENEASFACASARWGSIITCFRCDICARASD